MKNTFKVGDVVKVVVDADHFPAPPIMPGGTTRIVELLPHPGSPGDGILYMTESNPSLGFWDTEMELVKPNWKRKLGGIKCHSKSETK